MSDKDKVGELRAQSAHCPADRRVVLVSADLDVLDILNTLEVVRFYPDTTNEHGDFKESTFKIHIRKKPIAQR